MEALFATVYADTGSEAALDGVSLRARSPAETTARLRRRPNFILILLGFGKAGKLAGR